jgi:hypothetical protein
MIVRLEESITLNDFEDAIMRIGIGVEFTPLLKIINVDYSGDAIHVTLQAQHGDEDHVNTVAQMISNWGFCKLPKSRVGKIVRISGLRILTTKQLSQYKRDQL